MVAEAKKAMEGLTNAKANKVMATANADATSLAMLSAAASTESEN